MSYSYFSEMSSGEFIFVFGSMLILTIISYCTIPTILRFTLIKKKHFPKNKLICIVVINAILIFLTMHIIDFIISEENYDDISLYPAIIWSFVNYLILYCGDKKYHNNSTDHSRDKKIIVNSTSYSYEMDSNNIPNNWKNPDKKKHNESLNEMASKNIKDNIESENNIEEIYNNHQINIEHKTSFENSKDITKKTYTKKTIVILSGIIGLLFVICVGISIFAFTNISNLNTEMEAKKASLSSYSIAAHSYAESAVIVKDGDNKYYHRISCPQLGVEYRYLTFNPEAAKGDGYSECPICHELNINQYIEKYF